MFIVLKAYSLSCNNSCAGSSRPFWHVKNWFLKKRLDANLCQVLIYVKYTRDWQLNLKKNLQDWVVKAIIFTTQKMKLSVKDLFNKCEEIRRFMRTCSPLLNKFLTKKCEGENKFLILFFIFFEKVFAICKNFYHFVFRWKVLRPFVFYLFEFQSTVLVSSSSQVGNVLI